jgi:hypothetical protein
MAAGITEYLYGDSTPSPLKIDFIALLRDVVDFGVAVLQCDVRLADTAERAAAFAVATEREVEGAEALVAEVSRTLDHAPTADPQSLPGRCAVRIRQGAIDTVRSEVEAARAAVAGENARVIKEAERERQTCAKALSDLLLRHELPDETSVLHLQASGAQYKAELHGHAPWGLDWVATLEIPPASPLAQVLRVERIAERLEVQAPEEAGWLRKETKIRPQRLDRLYLVQLTIDPAETLIKLRAAPEGTGGGFDLSFRREPRRIYLVRVGEGDATTDAPYEIEGEDANKLRLLQENLTVLTVTANKKAIASASLDGTAVDQLDNPRVLVDRIVAHVAPTVQEIGRRSLAPGELALKRRVSETHREELFVSRAELEQKLQPLPARVRRVFDPLGLARPGVSRPPAPPLTLNPAASHAPPAVAPPSAPPAPPPILVTPTPGSVTVTPLPSSVAAPPPVPVPTTPGPAGVAAARPSDPDVGWPDPPEDATLVDEDDRPTHMPEKSP